MKNTERKLRPLFTLEYGDRCYYTTDSVAIITKCKELGFEPHLAIQASDFPHDFEVPLQQMIIIK